MRALRFDRANPRHPESVDLPLAPDRIQLYLENRTPWPTVYAVSNEDLDTFLQAANAFTGDVVVLDLGEQRRTPYRNRTGEQTTPLRQIFARARSHPAAVRTRYDTPNRFRAGIRPVLKASPLATPLFCFVGVPADIWKGLENDGAVAGEDPRLPSVRRAFTGESPEVWRVQKRILRFAKSPFPVFIRGPRGTGKEIVARAVHKHSGRQGFLPVNCAELAPGLVESELFGHEEGAFTGSAGLRIGLIEKASGGTLFLDEVAELPLEIQAKLLRVVQEGELRRVGGNEFHKVDVRVICATNRDVIAMAKREQFRPDLLDRISVLPIVTPALKNHRANFEAHLDRIWAALSADPILPAAVVERLWQYDWPGNVRELESVLVHLAIEYGSGAVTVAAVEAVLTEKTTGEPPEADGAEWEARRRNPGVRADVTGFADVRSDYECLTDVLARVCAHVTQSWKQAPIIRPWTLTAASVARRLQRGEAAGPVDGLRDLCGLRAVIASQEEKRALLNRLAQHLAIEGGGAELAAADGDFHPVTCCVRIDEARVAGIKTDFDVDVPARVVGRTAEIQVWTLVEAAWASLREDVGDEKTAALDLEDIEWTLTLERVEVEDIVRAGQLYARLGQWDRAIELLAPHMTRGGDVNRDLGLALCKHHAPHSTLHRLGLNLLRRAGRRWRRDRGGIASGIETWKRTGRDAYARDFHRPEVAPAG